MTTATAQLSPSLQTLLDEMIPVSEVKRIARAWNGKVTVDESLNCFVRFPKCMWGGSVGFRDDVEKTFSEAALNYVIKGKSVVYEVTTRDSRLAANPDVAEIYTPSY